MTVWDDLRTICWFIRNFPAVLQLYLQMRTLCLILLLNASVSSSERSQQIPQEGRGEEDRAKECSPPCRKLQKLDAQITLLNDQLKK